MTPSTIRPKSTNRASIAVAAAALMALIAVPASAQNLPPPGNVNPGSINSGAEQSGASNQPRSSAYGTYYQYRSIAPIAVMPFAPTYYGVHPRLRAAPFYDEDWGY